MDIHKVIQEYDQMFGKKTLEEIYTFLQSKIEEAEREESTLSKITLYNEMIGLCRELDRKEEGNRYCDELINLVEALGLGHTVEQGTIFLNVANAKRAFGLWEESLKFYRSAEVIYKEKLSEDAFYFASLYNNWGILYQEMGDYENAEKMIRRSLQIVDIYPEAYIEQASTRTNLAGILMQARKECSGQEKEAIHYLQQALALYERDERKDFHYSFALSAMGDAMALKGDYRKAAFYYEKGMREIESYVGRTGLYSKIREKYDGMQKFL